MNPIRPSMLLRPRREDAAPGDRLGPRRWLGPAGVPIVLLALLAGPPPAQAGPWTDVVSFGDSLTDTGNVFLLSGGTWPPVPPSYAGRFSNGPVWVDVLTAGLGLLRPLPSLDGGPNNAYGGAGTDFGTNSFVPPVPPFMPLTIPNTGKQVVDFKAGHSLTPTQLVTLWSGSNDLLSSPASPTSVVDDLAASLTLLAEAGGTGFLVPNILPFDKSPYGGSLTPAAQLALEARILAFNSLLAARLDSLQGSLGVTIYRLNAHGLFEAVIADPARFGLVNVTDQALAAPPGTDLNTYLWWDPVHPTSRGHQLLGQAALQELGVPEPATWAMLGLAALVLASGRRASWLWNAGHGPPGRGPTVLSGRRHGP